eukprot:scaffold317_cov260-Pinguiococcus_pyrenoidosus.AAC.37
MLIRVPILPSSLVGLDIQDDEVREEACVQHGEERLLPVRLRADVHLNAGAGVDQLYLTCDALHQRQAGAQGGGRLLGRKHQIVLACRRDLGGDRVLVPRDIAVVVHADQLLAGPRLHGHQGADELDEGVGDGLVSEVEVQAAASHRANV